MYDKINLISRRIVETAFFVALSFFVTSCESKSEKDIKEMVAEWDGKEIVFPLHSVYTIQGIHWSND